MHIFIHLYACSCRHSHTSLFTNINANSLICIYIHSNTFTPSTFIYLHAPTFTYAYLHSLMSIYIYLHAPAFTLVTRIYIHLCSFTRIYVCIHYICINLHASTFTHMHLHTSTCTYAHLHSLTCIPSAERNRGISFKKFPTGDV